MNNLLIIILMISTFSSFAQSQKTLGIERQSCLGELLKPTFAKLKNKKGLGSAVGTSALVGLGVGATGAVVAGTALSSALGGTALGTAVGYGGAAAISGPLMLATAGIAAVGAVAIGGTYYGLKSLFQAPINTEYLFQVSMAFATDAKFLTDSRNIPQSYEELNLYNRKAKRALKKKLKKRYGKKFYKAYKKTLKYQKKLREKIDIDNISLSTFIRFFISINNDLGGKRKNKICKIKSNGKVKPRRVTYKFLKKKFYSFSDSDITGNYQNAGVLRDTDIPKSKSKYDSDKRQGYRSTKQ